MAAACSDSCQSAWQCSIALMHALAVPNDPLVPGGRSCAWEIKW